MGLIEKTILQHDDFFAKSLDINITKSDVIDKINAFDWLDLTEANTPEQYYKVMFSIFDMFNFKYQNKYDDIIRKAFANLFIDAVDAIKESILAVSKSYNIEGNTGGFRNPIVDKFYYIEFWAEKKNIPVNYNEKDKDKRNLFNFDTIILSILSDKLKSYNDYERNKPKK